MLRLEGVQKRYASGSQWIQVLKGVDMEVARGEIVALMGPSGVGKSTLLHLIAGLDRPDEGRIVMDEREVTKLRNAALDQFRLQSVGIVYQFHFLLPEFTALENVCMPAVVAGKGSSAKARAMQLLEEVGIAHRAHHIPGKLSGGEQQRVAIARALMNNPSLLLADEPTGNLDEESAAQVFQHLGRMKQRHSLTVLMATHNSALAAGCDRTIRLRDGKVW
jgi:lipoprotein-releasing system ATP-binding protein